MKTKLILFTILGLLFSSPIFSKTNNVTPYNPEEKVYWDFIKERLFDGDNSYVSSFQGDIVIQLRGAARQDSIIVKNLQHELKQIITNRKVDWWGNCSKDEQNILLSTLISVTISDQNVIGSNIYIHRSKEMNGNQIFYDGFKGEYQPQIYMQNMSIVLNDTVSYKTRKQYIEYAIVKSLCHIIGKERDANTFVEGAILSDFDYNPLNTKFSEADKFLLQKLYSHNFQKQFKRYMVENYSWRYYLTFTHKIRMKKIGILSSSIIALLILLLSYNPIIKRNYRNNFFAYLIPAILMACAVYLIQSVYYYLATEMIVFGKYKLQEIIHLNLFAIIMSTALYVVERYSIKPSLKFSMQLVLKTIYIFLIVVIPLSVRFYFRKYFEWFDLIDLCVTGIALAIGRMTVLYFKRAEELAFIAKDAELSKLKEVNTRVEIQSLHARINPHFLYNSLNSIAGLAHSNPDKTEKMALSLSDMFRYSLNRKNEVLADINDEVEMVRSYLEIEQIRFGERMSFSIEMDDELKTKQIPKFILQPLVENAIKHGISKIEGKGEISLSITKVNQGIEIEVSDNGPDFPEGLVAGYGLQSLYDLLKICYKDAAEVNWQNSPCKLISVKIPLNTKMN